MDQPVPYEEDVFLWSQQQAETLRRLAETRPDLPNDLDLRDIAEEIEDVGRGELKAVAGFITHAVRPVRAALGETGDQLLPVPDECPIPLDVCSLMQSTSTPSSPASWLRGRRPSMIEQARFEEDVFLWSRHQAAALRRLALTRPEAAADLDLPHIADAVEGLGRCEVEAVSTALTHGMAALIRLANLPDGITPCGYLREEVKAFAREVRRRYTAGMADHLDLDKAWRAAVDEARWSAEEHGCDLAVSGDCPLTLADLVDGEPDLGRLVGKVRAACH